MIPRAQQARLIGGLGPHEFPGDKKIRAHIKLKHAPALRSGNFSLPVTRFATQTPKRQRRRETIEDTLTRKMDGAIANAGLECRCTWEIEAGLPYLRPCVWHQKVMR